MTHDYSADIAPPSEDNLKRLQKLVSEYLKLQIEGIDLQARLDVNKSAQENYAENLLPALMDELGFSELSTRGGSKIEVKDVIHASFPSGASQESLDKQKRAFSYLEETGNDGLVKRQFTLQYGRDQQEWAERFEAFLKESNIAEQAVVEKKKTIHHQTLMAFIRKELADGRNIPLDAFGAFVKRTASVKSK